jgi:hypothetical protein
MEGATRTTGADGVHADTLGEELVREHADHGDLSSLGPELSAALLWVPKAFGEPRKAARTRTKSSTNMARYVSLCAISPYRLHVA